MIPNKTTTNQQLTAIEKTITMRSIFHAGGNNQVENVGDYIVNNFDKIDGFDYRWSSLITNNPLLFEDIDYLRVKPFVNNICTEEEILAYKNGELSELYATFDNMLICNLKYYDRIMSFCTMIFLGYVNINDNQITKGLNNIPLEFDMTPTRIWCCVMSSIKSTEFELKYAWGDHNISFIDNSDKSILEQTYHKLYKNKRFAKFVEFCSIRNNNVNGFRTVFIMDKTSNRKLAQVCSKFTKTSTAISIEQLNTIYDYHQSINSSIERLYYVLDKCLSTLFNADSSQYSIYIYADEYYIHTSKFSLKVTKSTTGKITKDYLSNSYECFAAEEFLIPSIKTQIDWAKSKMPNHYDYDRNVLISLLANMLEKNFREIICIKRFTDRIFSKIRFQGIFNNVKMIEEFMVDNRIIKVETKTLSKRNSARYIVNRGYILFGTVTDMIDLDNSSVDSSDDSGVDSSTENKSILSGINKNKLIEHYSNYCIPVYQHMYDVIVTHQMSKNEIIDILTTGYINPDKIKNDEIMETSIFDFNSKTIFNQGLAKQNKNTIINKKSYWKVREE